LLFHGTHRAGHRSTDTVLRARGTRQREDRCEEMTVPSQSEERLSEVRFLTVAEVAALMRVSKMTVYRLVHGGDLTAVRVGRSFRVPEHAVHEYLRAAFSQTA
jgi:excisionase family DNA binding protein